MLIAKWTYNPLPRPNVCNAPCVLESDSNVSRTLHHSSQTHTPPQISSDHLQATNAALHQPVGDEHPNEILTASYIGFDGSDSPDDIETGEKVEKRTATLDNATQDEGKQAKFAGEGSQAQTNGVPERIAFDADEPLEFSAPNSSAKPATKPSTKILPTTPIRRAARTRIDRQPSTMFDLEPIDVAIQEKLSAANAVLDTIEPMSVVRQPAKLPEGTGIRNLNPTAENSADVDSSDGNRETSGISSNPDEGVAKAGPNISPIELPPTPEESVKPIQLSPQMRSLHEDIETCLAYYYARPEDTKTRSPWGVMHSLIAFGVDTKVLVKGEEMNAIGWITWNQPCRGMKLFKFDKNGKMDMPLGPGYQGHEGQLLAMLAQSKVRKDYQMKIEGRDLTIDDLIEYEQEGCRVKTELTFKLIGLVHYLDTDSTWTSNDGESWDFEKLIREELAQKVIGSACGGTHRMMGFSYAVNKREKEGKPMTGQWKRAKEFVNAYHAYTFKLQNRDGSFSTKWFEGREAKRDVDRRIQTTGHILEWMLCSLPDDQLQDPRIVRATQYLTYTMWKNRGHKWEIGPQGHALHALVLYNEMVFDKRPGDGGEHLMEVARRKGLTR
jgi:hypothetical protein